jgi:NADPH-dependent F420 reductase
MRRPRAAAQGSGEQRGAVEPPRRRQQGAQVRHLIRIHDPMVPDPATTGGCIAAVSDAVGNPRLPGLPGSRDVCQDRRMTAEQADLSRLVIGVLGGTGEQGRGLARRLALAGHQVIIGSRDAGRAHAATVGLDCGPLLMGGGNHEAAEQADVVIAAMPWEGHRSLLTALAGPLAGKVLVDCVNPMGFDGKGAYALAVPEGSAAQQAAAVLPDSTVVGAFHHVPATLLLDPYVDRIEMDVLVLGDDRQATDLVASIADRIPGMRGVYGGRLRNCGQIEAFTANLVSINRRYKAHAGIRITGV